MTRAARIRHRLRCALRDLAALPATLRNAPPLPKDTGVGHVLRYERDAWVVRPSGGWRAHFGRPLHSNRQLGPYDDDAASDWALDVTAGNPH